MNRRYSAATLIAALALVCMPMSALAQMSTPGVASLGPGHTKWTIEVTAGPTGAPEGFVVWWMKASDFASVNWTWFPTGNAIQASMYFTGNPTLNTWDGQFTTFLLGPNETVRLELGDLADESGVYGNALAIQELQDQTEYVFCAWALGDGSVEASAYSQNVYGTTTQNGRDCQHSQGYWKNHPSAWPVTSLTLGTVTYTQAQLLSILHQPTQGNGLVSMAKQLIATKLNVALGANPGPIQNEINQADAMIGGLVIPPVGSGHLPPSQTSKLTQDFDDFNNGKIRTTCDATDALPSTWGRVKSMYR